MKNISFAAGSFAGPFSQHELESIRRLVRLDIPYFEFDPEYLGFIATFHGGKPIQKYFATVSGVRLPIDYFLNFQESNNDHFDSLSVSAVWSAIDDRSSPELIPFATTPGGDFLCFQAAQGSRPSIVLWSHELSEEDNPHTEFVATDFSQFISSLQSEPMAN